MSAKNIVLALLLLAIAASCNFGSADWRTASRAQTGIAPDPAQTPEAVIQVYAARAYSWRGIFGVHTWFATKPSHAKSFTVYEVAGWYAQWGGSVVAIHEQAPDRRWFGNAPVLLAEKRGEGVDELIKRVDAAAQTYPYEKDYTVWPGPNSNTFTAWLSRAVPEIGLNLPPTAIGKDYLGDNITATAPSGNGWQFSVLGLFGVIVSDVEGYEINLLGLTFGIKPDPFAIKLPLIGQIDLSA
ncbi:hypothetical protein Nstercoris_01478 [Nitrosomonas stercoris]|uniref:DUF3750 domain-containing protein n=1 Tax=Nitrosomonas stercoris TaxID=1444684 RepID=A0A4Y1YM78_9PROT|nr:hypothetical protein Nstercoris_01478 [Nitrosomonas stercoris]